MHSKENLLKQWLFLYSLAVEGAVGVYVAVFLLVYSKLSLENGNVLLQKYYLSLLILAGIVTLIMAPLYIFSMLIKGENHLPQWYQRLKRNAFGLLSSTVLLYILYLLHVNDVHLKWVELILAFGFIYIFYSYQNTLLLHGYPAWQNVTTTLNLLFGVGKIMFTAWIIIYHVYDLQEWISLFLILELFVMFWRMKTLNQHGPETKQAVRYLLVQHSLLFGARLIVGLFIPLIFTLYQWMINGRVTGIIMLFILFGELLERFLFTFSAIPRYYDYEPEE